MYEMAILIYLRATKGKDRAQLPTFGRVVTLYCCDAILLYNIVSQTGQLAMLLFARDMGSLGSLLASADALEVRVEGGGAVPGAG
jgi:hypothetical protein